MRIAKGLRDQFNFAVVGELAIESQLIFSFKTPSNLTAEVDVRNSAVSKLVVIYAGT